MDEKISAELKQTIVAEVSNLHEAVKRLNNLYEEHPELNDHQPASFGDVICGSLDDWSFAIAANIDDWKNLPVAPDSTALLVKEFNDKYATWNGWKFDYMYNGYFSYYKDDRIVFFTPDFECKGSLNCQIQTGDGEYLEGKDVPYPKPLSAKFMFQIAVDMMMKIDARKSPDIKLQGKKK